jgi:hypothetical protein
MSVIGRTYAAAVRVVSMGAPGGYDSIFDYLRLDRLAEV